MKVDAIKGMEDFARQVLRLPEQKQNEFFESLSQKLNDEDVLMLKKCVGVYHIMTDATLYKTVQKSLCETICKEFNEEV